jgi:CO/xanthine dehydrogenase FAD-binding subunit
MMSVALPGVNGTMTRTGFVGQDCAHAVAHAASNTAAANHLCTLLIVLLLVGIIFGLKSAPFEYTRCATLDEACDSLARRGEEAKLLAGGQSLVPMMAMRLLRPAWLVDINEISELKFVSIEAQTVRIGACTRQVELERNEALAVRLPLMREAFAFVGHVQTRNRGTLGGSLAHADPTAELPLLAKVLGARMSLRSIHGTRTVEAGDFFTGAMSTALRADEVLEEIRWPLPREPRTGSAFVEHSIRHGDFAIVAAAAQLSLDAEGCCTSSAFGFGGMGVVPLAFHGTLVGTPLDDDALDHAVQAAVTQCEPLEDLHASREYRRHLARVLGGRALRIARKRASERIVS